MSTVTLEEFREFLAGRASPEVHARVAAELADADSELRRMIEADRESAALLLDEGQTRHKQASFAPADPEDLAPASPDSSVAYGSLGNAIDAVRPLLGNETGSAFEFADSLRGVTLNPNTRSNSGTPGDTAWEFEVVPRDCKWLKGDASLARGSTGRVLATWRALGHLDVSTDGFLAIPANGVLEIVWATREGDVRAKGTGLGACPYVQLITPAGTTPGDGDRLLLRLDSPRSIEGSTPWELTLELQL